jgi:hypothetical protein
MDRLCRRSIGVAILVMFLLVAAGTLGAGNVAAQESVNITLDEPDSVSHDKATSTNQVPQVQPSEALTYDNGANYEFITTETDTGGEIITTAPVQMTTDNRVILQNPVVGGVQETNTIWFPGKTEQLDGPVESTGTITTGGVANLSVSLADASSGEVIDQTTSKPFVVGYVADYEQDSTSGSIELSVNQSSLPADSSVTATVFSADATFPDETSDKTSVSLTHDASTSAFTGTFDSTSLAGGTYDVDVTAELPPRYGTEFSTIDRDVVNVTESDDSDPGTETGVVEDTVALNGSTVTINGGDVNAIGVSGFPDAYYSVSDIGAGTLQESDNGVIWNTGGTVSFTLTPPESAEAGDTVTFDLKIGQQDPQSVTLEVVEQNIPDDLPDSISSAKYSAVAGDDSDISTFDLVDAIQGASDDGTYNGQEFSTFDFVDLIQWNS